MDIKCWIVKNIPSNGIIVEAGTANGADTLFFSHHVKDGFVYGFEPHPSLYEETLEKIKGRQNVSIDNLALSDKTEQCTFYVSDRFDQLWGSSSILKPKDHLTYHPQITFKREIVVDAINLDEWFATKQINRIDLMWLDMQGAEPIVLNSAPIILSLTKYLYTEVSVIETYEGVILYNDFKKMLNGMGFELINDDDMCGDMGNALFKNKNLSS